MPKTTTVTANDLLDIVIERHGGIGRRYEASTVSATVHVYGAFWAFNGQPGLLGLESVTADIQRQRITLTPLGNGSTLEVDAALDRVRITGSDEFDELIAPRRSMAGYTGDTKWSAAQIGYFISYATWMYLLEPFLFTLHGVQTREIEPWSELGETWRRLEVTFPPEIATHSPVQTYYFDAHTGLQRRMDYSPDVNGKPLVAHYTTEHHDFGAQRRRRRGPELLPHPPRCQQRTARQITRRHMTMQKSHFRARTYQASVAETQLRNWNGDS